MKKVFLLMVVVSLFFAGNIYAQSKPVKAESMPAPLVYKSRVELDAEIKRLEALGEARSWQEDFTLGVAYMHAARLERALTLIEKTIRERPSFIRAYESLGMVFFRRGDMKEAVSAWERAIKVNLKAVHLRKMIVFANDRIAIRKQVARLLLAVGKDGKDWKPHFELSRLYMKLKDGSRALDHIKKAISLKGSEDDPRLLEALGRAFGVTGDFKSARVAFRKALAAAPDFDKRRLGGMAADMDVLGSKMPAKSKGAGEKTKSK